jgi:hypothetical protein
MSIDDFIDNSKRDIEHYNPYTALSCAVIMQAIEDARMDINPRWNRECRLKAVREKREAIYFLGGGQNSSVDMWCDFANLSREAMQEKLFKKKELNHGRNA